MNYDIDDIRAMVADIEDKRVDYVEKAFAAERMWMLEPFQETRETYLHLDGQEALATADPYNIIQLLLRFVSGEPRIEIPYLSAKDEDDKRSETIERWLVAFWQRWNHIYMRNLIQDMTWYSGVRGCGAGGIMWTGGELPERITKLNRQPPVMPRILDPLNVGVCNGPWGAEYGYHKYEATRSYVEQTYPKYELPEEKGFRRNNNTYKIIDMYYAEADGIYHCVLIDDKFAISPVKTKHVYIPYFEWAGDSAPIDNEVARRLPLLHPIDGLWQAKSRVVSKMATGIMYYFDPILKLKNPKDQPWKGNITVKPGATFELTGEQDAVFDRPEPNVPLAMNFLNAVDAQIQQATFPSVMYGEQGGAVSGYAINQLASSARGRINSIRMNLESAMELADEIVLSQVEIFGGEEGITVWAGGTRPGERGSPLTLKASDIKSNYNNDVRLVPEIPTDETQRLVTWDTLVEHGRVSNRFYQDRIINVPVPSDEQNQIAFEAAVKNSPELQQKLWLAAIRVKFEEKEQWRRLIAGTPYEMLAQKEDEWVAQQEAAKEAARQARAQAKEQSARQEEEQKALDYLLKNGEPPKGWHVMPGPGGAPTLMKDGDMGPESTNLPPMMPPGMPMDLGAMPPQMGPNGPPTGMPPLPPETGMPMLPNGEPGLMPSAGAMGMPSSGQSPLPPGVPPEMGAGLTPEMLGVPPQGGPPGMFQAMQGEPLTDEEIARRLLGAMRGGPPPQR